MKWNTGPRVFHAPMQLLNDISHFKYPVKWGKRHSRARTYVHTSKNDVGWCRNCVIWMLFLCNANVLSAPVCKLVSVSMCFLPLLQSRCQVPQRLLMGEWWGEKHKACDVISACAARWISQITAGNVTALERTLHGVYVLNSIIISLFFFLRTWLNPTNQNCVICQSGSWK